MRVAAGSPALRLADTQYNTQEIKTLMAQAHSQGAQVLVLPEMCVTGYTCGDLFHSCTLLAGAKKAVEELVDYSKDLKGLLSFVGAPYLCHGKLYNCAFAICEGKIKGIVPKTYLPNYNEFYEQRWFTPFTGESESYIDGDALISLDANMLFEHHGVAVGVELCEDLWTPNPPSTGLCLAGAELIVNLSASPDHIGKYHYLVSLLKQQSARCICAYAYASAGFGESTTDLVFDAKLMVAENGRMLKTNKRWQRGNQLIVTDIDLEAIRRDRMHNTSFHVSRRDEDNFYSNVETDSVAVPENPDLLRDVDAHPFIPAKDEHLAERCEEIINIQMTGLAQRLAATGCKSLVVGISGGLDSTLALLVAVRAFDSLGLDRKGIVGVTMPGFGTTGRTYRNAIELMKALGIRIEEISIVPAVNQHFKDIKHDASVHDVTYENSQARERTQILMDLANKVGGMVLGTGDLSELALGWATYNGDHMSMYGVNAGVPKTLVKHLVRYFAEQATDASGAILHDIVDTPVSPELLPPDKDGNIEQKTEDLVGPYELHDFFLYYVLRYGFGPARIYTLARKAFGTEYSDDTIKKWLKTFFRRFFNQQFKRSALPDGPKVGSVCLSPRGDWRMPSDASSRLWLDEAEAL